MPKHTYRSVTLQQVDVIKLCAALGASGTVAIDIAKTKMMAGFADSAGDTKLIVRFEHPTQTLIFLALVCAVRDRGVALDIAMEPTGVYGDALRHQLRLRSFVVFRVDCKKVHDAAELFDGVPSLHDAKSCVLIARLHAMKRSKVWRERTARERNYRALVDERDMYARPFEQAYGQLEAVVAKIWPELSNELDMQRKWPLRLLALFPSPALVVANRTEAFAAIKGVRGNFPVARVNEILALANGSLGEKMTEHEHQHVRALAQHMLGLRARIDDVDQRIEKEISSDEESQTLVTALGAVTTAVLIADLGHPSSFASAAAFEKALGLNLKIKSSGEKKGQLHITKRGPARPRRYLFLAALRLVRNDHVARAWYERRKGYIAEIKLVAVVALMRKLARAIFHVARGARFDATKLFDTRRLGITAPSPSTQPSIAP